MNWHALPLEKIFSSLESNESAGLSSAEAEKRLATNGKNVLPRENKKTVWHFLFLQLQSPLVYILLIAAILTSGLAVFVHADESGILKWVDTIVILLAVLVNVAVGFFQEFRANGILTKLTKAVHATAFVIRDSGIHEIDSVDLVSGDVVLLKQGKKVPADVRIIESSHLEIDESTLTGESASVTKNIHTVASDTPVADRRNMGYMGTVVTHGGGKAIVVETGNRTQIGQIATMTQESEQEETPLQKRVGHLGRMAAIFIAIASVVIFAFGIISGRSIEEMITTTIAIFVAAVPEGLPAALSIVLAVAAQKILNQRGVVKHLLSAETLGSCSVICTDKTGTLTEGKMRVRKLLVSSRNDEALQTMAFANEAVLEELPNGKTVIRGETTDQAKIQAFLDGGKNLKEALRRDPRVSMLGFDPSKNFIASLHRNNENGNHKLYVSGAPEAVLERCETIATENERNEWLTDERREELRKTYEDLARGGFRMIGLAIGQISEESLLSGDDLLDKAVEERLVKKMIFLGFAAIADPIRADVPDSIAKARSAGVHTVMMTGDHILTARAIGKELGFRTDPDSVMEGKALDTMSEGELSEKLDTVEIFARVSPEHKMRIISVLQKKGEVVAMTGDGVNDAPALKKADIGVAVNSGTDIAKEASDLVLLDDSFTTIVLAIRRGRVAFSNIRKVCIFLFSASFTELVLILLAVFLKFPLPLTAVMILWTNLVGDSLPNIALAFEPAEEGVMKRKPLSRHEPIFNLEGKLIVAAVVTVSSFILFLLFLGLYSWSDLSLEHIQTILFASLGIGTFFYVYSIKSLRRPIWSYNIFSNKILLYSTVLGLLSMALAVYVPFLNLLLGTVPLRILDWGIVITTSFVNVVVVEAVKLLFFRRSLEKIEESEAATLADPIPFH